MASMARPLAPSSRSSLMSRLKLDNESSNCRDSLAQHQSCTGEIILLFLNGETYLGQGCCQATRTIGNECWPTMMETLGFPEEEGDILEGYCDHETSDLQSSPSTPSITTVATMKALVP